MLTSEEISKIEIQDVDATARDMFRKRYVPYVVGGVILAGLLAFGFFKTGHHEAGTRTVVFSIIAGAGLYRTLWNKVNDEFRRQFAKAMGWTYKSHGRTKGTWGVLFEAGSEHRFDDMVMGIYDGRPLRLYTFHFVIGVGKYKSTHDYTVFEISYDTDLPEIQLHRDHSFWAKPRGERISLEKIYDDHFNLYAPKGYEIEALQIFTPELLEQLIGKSKNLSFEFCKNKMYIYTDHIIGTKAELMQMSDLAHHLSEHLAPFLKRLTDDIQVLRPYFKAYRKIS